MADLTLPQLLAAPTADQIRDRIFARLNRADFPVTDFHEGAVARTIVEAVSSAIADFVGALIPRIAAGGFATLAKGDWLSLLGQENFLLARLPASFTTQAVRLYAAAGVGPYSLAVGQLVLEAPSGNRYVLDAAGTIPVGTVLGESGAGTEGVDFVTLAFKAESPGSKYADPAGSLTRLITPLPGVLAVNRAPTFSAVGHDGDGTGSITLSGSPAGAARFSIRILTDGQADAATFEFSLDGAPYLPGGVAASTGVVLTGGSVVTFVNGVIPSFIAGETFTFSTPGSPIITQGADTETDAHLAGRIAARWPALSQNALDDVYEQWAYAASDEVTKVRVRPVNTESTPGRVEIMIAGAVNPLVGAVGLVQAYVDARHPITDDPLVVAADAVSISALGDVHVYAKDLVRIQTAAQLAWQMYLNELPIGGIVRSAELAQILMDLDAIEFQNIFVGPTSDVIWYSYQLQPDEVAVANVVDTLLTELNWIVF